MIGVVDTSALIRLFIPDGPLAEGFVEFIRGVERGLNVAIAPELMAVETASVVSKKLKLEELTNDESRQLLADLLALPIRPFPHHPILFRAFELAGDYGLTVYDTLYLALAEEHSAVIFSADQKLLKTAAKMGLR